MKRNCSAVIFSNKAYNAIIRETFDKHPIETGGILLGYIIDDAWVVMEVLPPGINSIFQTAYFEYDTEFVNYLADSVASQYKQPLSLLGLWHRHPGHMDVFSSTDDITNRTFAALREQGTISGLVNVDPEFRITMYHLDKDEGSYASFHRPSYEIVDVEVGDDIIPEQYFELKYYSSAQDEQHPRPTTFSPRRTVNTGIRRTPMGEQTGYYAGETDEDDNEPPKQLRDFRTSEIVDELLLRAKHWTIKRLKLIVFIIFLIAVISLLLPKSCNSERTDAQKEWTCPFKKKDKDNDKTHEKQDANIDDSSFGVVQMPSEPSLPATDESEGNNDDEDNNENSENNDNDGQQTTDI